MFKYVGGKIKRGWAMITNTKFPIPISLQPDVVELIDISNSE